MWRQVHSFTEWLLNKYLARYLSNVNLHQVHIGLTQGSVELENLKLREDALENFNLPFKIVDGTVGKLVLQVPVAGLSSGSLVLCLSNLNIQATPYQGTEYDPVKDEEQRLAALNLKLEALEQQIYQKLYAHSKSWLSSFASSYFTSMIENLKLVINDVHFCYTDTVSVASMPFSLGITIKHLATQPSPNKVGDCVLKEVHLEGLGIYWNFGENSNTDEKCYVLEPISATVELTQNKSAEPLNSLQTPRFTASLTLQTVQFCLSSKQYHLAARILNIIDWQRRVKKNRKWHPDVPILGNAGVWWRFAISAVRHPISRRMERERPSFVSARAKLLVKYVDLYTTMLSKHEIKDLIKSDIKPLEEGLSYDELYIMRSLALSRVQTPPAAVVKSQQQGWGSWMRGWGYYGGPSMLPPPSPTEGDEEAVDYSIFFDKDSVFGKVSAKLLHGSILLMEYQNTGTHKPLVQLTFDDLILGAEYRMKTDTTILSASLQNITLDNHCQHSSLFPHVVSRSRGPATYTSSERGEETVSHCAEVGESDQQPDDEDDVKTSPSSEDRSSPSRREQCEEKPVLDVYYELNPLPTTLDILLRVTTLPLDIVYNEDIITRVTNFFALDPTIDFVVEAALARLGDLRSKTKHQLRSTIDKIFSGKMRDFRRWDILCKIQAPLLIIPESFHNSQSAVVILDLGQVVLDNKAGLRARQSLITDSRCDTNGSDSNFSTPPSTPNDDSITDIQSYFTDQSHSSSQQPSISRNISPTSLATSPSDALYETFSVQLSDLRVHAGMFTHMMMSETRESGQLMDRFSLDMKLERRLVFSLDPLHPNILVSANVPKLAFQLNVTNMTCLLRCLRSISSVEKPDRAAPAPTPQTTTSTSEDGGNGGNVTHSISASLQHSMKPETLMHAHLVDVKLHVEKISMTVTHGRQLDLELHIDDVELSYTKQPFGSELSLLISTLTICDRTQQYKDESYMMACSFPFAHTAKDQWYSSPEITQSDALIMVEVLEIGPDYPNISRDVAAKTPGTRYVDIKLNYLDLLPHHTTLAHLLGFGKRVSHGRKEQVRVSGVWEETGVGGVATEDWQYDVKVGVEHVSLGLLDPRDPRRKIGSVTMLGVSLGAERTRTAQQTRLTVAGIHLRELGNERTILGLGERNTESNSPTHHALSITRTKTPNSTSPDITILDVASPTLPSPDTADASSTTDTPYTAPLVTTDASSIKNPSDNADTSSTSLSDTADASFTPNPSVTVDASSTPFSDTADASSPNFPPRITSSVDAHVGSLQYFHSPSFTSAVISSINSLLLLVEEQVSQISTRATQAANRVINYGDVDCERVSFSVLIESPVVQLPRGAGSRDTLVGHLGNVTIRNEYCAVNESLHHRILLDVDNIHLYSAVQPHQLGDEMNLLDDKPILHDTTLNVVVEQKRTHRKNMVVVQTNITAEIPQGLRVTLSKKLYEQVIETMQYATSLRGPVNRVRTSSSLVMVDTVLEEERISLVKEIRSDFVLPEVLILLQGDLLDSSTPDLALVKFEDFTVSWSKTVDCQDVYVTLHKLNIIDMLQPSDSPAKYLFKSRHRARTYSCTDDMKLIRSDNQQLPISPHKNKSDMKALVSIRIVDNRTDNEGEIAGKCVVVDLNCVDMTVNLQSWVMLLDFITFSSATSEKVVRGSQAVSDFLHDMSDSSKTTELRAPSDEEKPDKTTICVQMKEWNITLNKNEYQLALCRIEGVSLTLSVDPNMIQCQGRMEGLSIDDLSPSAGLFRNKFSVLDNEVLQFDFKKNNKVDRDLLLGYDSSLELHMSAIRYVHTKRFLAETLAFLDHFIVLDNSLQVNRNAVITGTYREVTPKHGHRILLDVQMKCPVVVVPVTPSSAHVLVGYPGNIEVSNSFRFATEEETHESTQESGRESSSLPCLLDCLDIKLRDMDVVSAVWDANQIKQASSLLSEKCLLTLLVRRNLDSTFNHSSPNLCVRGQLSKTAIRITETDLARVKGFLGYNMSEDIGEFVISREHITDAVNVEKIDLDGVRCWLDIDIAIQLDNVSIELLHRKTDHSLAKFDLTSSSLAFQTYSNKHSVVKLTSRLLTLRDSRPASGNSFPLVVTQREDFHPDWVQVEINMRNTPHKKRWSFVLNKVKVHCVMDFLTLVKVFVTSDVSSPERLLKEHISGLPPVGPAPVKQIDRRDFDISLSIINTELVLPEMCSQSDSQAVVLQLTTVVAYKQQFHSLPKLSVTFEDVQMFSCTCGNPGTALSIMDVGTMSIELRHDMGGNRSLRTGSLLDSTQSSAIEFHFESMNTKLSYQDTLLFYNIMESVRRQLNAAVVIAADLDTPIPESGDMLQEEVVTQQQTVIEEQAEVEELDNYVNLVAVEVKCDSVSLCVIDDYGDRDIPLFLALLSGVELWCERNGHTVFSNTLRVDYHNSYVSGWEPLLEPWKVNVHYNYSPEFSQLKIDASTPLNLNLTHSFYKLALTTLDRVKPVLSGDVTVDRKVVRKPFIPFRLRNYTGFELKFACEVKTHPLNDPDPVSARRPSAVVGDWRSVLHGEETVFSFREGSVSRHRRHKVSHVLQSRSLRICVGDWEEMTNISVDQVGQFFRDPRSTESSYGDDSRIRIVFDMVLEEGARKCITVHSALTLRNNTTAPLEVKLQNPISTTLPSQLLPLLSPNETAYVPVDKVDWLIRVRPHGVGFDFSSSIKWDSSPTKCHFYECTNSLEDKFYISAVIDKGNFPEERGDYLPGHVIRFETPVVLFNSLPVELTFKIIGGGNKEREGIVRPSEKHCLYEIDPHLDITLSFELEGYTKHQQLFPYSSTNASRKSFLAWDEMDRKLPVHVACHVTDQYCWTLVPYVSYIIYNLTQYPLLFSHVGVGEVAAGQYSENETARILHPFMFDFTHDSQPRHLSVRIGKNYRHMRPLWSSGLDLSKPFGSFSVRCNVDHGRPGKVFDLSYECSVGSGMQSGVTTVKIVPKFQLENQSSHKIQYGQWYQINNQSQSVSDDAEPIIEAGPDSVLPFTWPRNDLDQLLSVRVSDISDCGWSGGFSITDTESWVVSMRGRGGRKIFLQCSVVLQKGTYHVGFTDFNDLPNPYRIENHSRVCVEYRQAETTGDLVKLEPGEWVRYHWDEPVLKPHALELQVRGGEKQTYKITPTDPYTHLSALLYENAVYLTLVDTWEGGAPVMKDVPVTLIENKTFSTVRVDERLAQSSSRLVLDVPQGEQVLVKQYNPHSITQLWQVTATGQLMHFKTKKYLDIPGRSPNPGTYASLTLKDRDESRTSTQTWNFHDTGYLKCLLPDMAVSVRNGTLHDGSDAVLDMISKSPPHIRPHKRRPGSGAVLVKTALDGPTVVVQLLDAQEGVRHVYRSGSEVIRQPPRLFQLQVKLVCGIGLSVMNHVPEEILYLSMEGLTLTVDKDGDKLSVEFSLASIQADNQCREALVPVVLYPCFTVDSKTSCHVRVRREVRGDGKLVVYPEIQAYLADFSVQLDEVLLLKLMQFFEIANEAQKKTTRTKPEAEFKLTNRRLAYSPILVENIQITKILLNVSLIVSPILEDDLMEIRNRLGLKSYLNFSDVSFELSKFQASNVIAAPSIIRGNIFAHYRTCAEAQKLKIVLNSEMTGNMGGLLSDLLSGFSVGLEGDVGGMVKNVAHGMSDTASKLSSTASTMLTYVSADETFRADRDRLRAARYQSSSASLRAGWKGLTSGIVGGLTSIPTQVTRGYTEDGVSGGVTGLVKGVIGTVVKPAAGLLDFASGTTLAITQSTRSNQSKGEVKRVRLPRCCSGETLSPYSIDTAQGMATMWSLNKKCRNEKFMSWAVINGNLKILISSDRIRVIEKRSGNKVLKEIMLDNVGKCECVSESSQNGTVYHLVIEIHDTPRGYTSTRDVSSRKVPFSSTKFTCDSHDIALKVSQDIHYAIGLRQMAAFLVTTDSGMT